MHFGFSYVGFLYLLMLFIPNIIWTKKQPEDYGKYVLNENKVMQAFERVGEVLVCCIVLLYSDFNIGSIRKWSLFLILSFVCMLLYECYWVRYFKSERKMKDFYSNMFGIPVAGATLPVLAFFMLAVYGKNIFLMGATIILGIGHIYIHMAHRKKVEDSR